MKADKSAMQEMTPSSKGYVTLPFDTGYLIVTCNTSSLSSLSGKFWFIGDAFKPKIYENVIDDLNEVEAIESQTDVLTDTTGSSDIVSGVVGQGQTISQNLSFVTQTAQFAGGVWDAFNQGSVDSTGLLFPGLTIMGHTIIAQQYVSFDGYLPNNTMELIRTGTTTVLFLGWIMGLVGFYHKIFLGETEVEIVEE